MTNLTLHQALDINAPIGCGDVAVFPGDIVVGDREGVVVIPAHLADEIAAEAVEMTAFEDFVTDQGAAGASILGPVPAHRSGHQGQIRRVAQRTGPLSLAAGAAGIPDR